MISSFLTEALVSISTTKVSYKQMQEKDNSTNGMYHQTNCMKKATGCFQFVSERYRCCVRIILKRVWVFRFKYYKNFLTCCQY